MVGEKIVQFQPKSPFISETVNEIVPRYGSVMTADRSVSAPVTLSDLERRDARSQIFQQISVITLSPFDLERPNSPG